MAWVAVDRDGTEKIFGGIPVRRCDVKSIFYDAVTLKIIRRAYKKNQYYKWAAAWRTDDQDPLPEGSISLPKGTIRKLIGKDLTWEDEPVKLE